MIASFFNADPQYDDLLGASVHYDPESGEVDHFLLDYATENEKKEYEKAVDKVLDKIDPDWCDEEKLLYIHDYIVTHCRYDDEAYEATSLDIDPASYTAYGALVLHKAVSYGYADAFEDLATRVGVETFRIKSDELNHVWNLVSLNGKKYYVDCTWDDSLLSSVDKYEYFYEQHCKHDNFLVSQTKLTQEGHNSTDWVVTYGGDEVYGLYDDKTYDDASWQRAERSRTVCVDGGYLFLDSSDWGVYRHSFGDNTDELIVEAAGGTKSWPIFGKETYYPFTFGSLAEKDGFVYVNDAKNVYLIDVEAKTLKKLYTLTTEERAKGYIFGICDDEDSIVYSVATDFNEANKKSSGSVFVGKELAPGKNYYKSKDLPDLSDITDHVERLMAVARSQIGYRGTLKGGNKYSVYADWAEQDGRNWCSEFASWCAARAGIPQTVIPLCRSTSQFMTAFSEKESFYLVVGGAHPAQGEDDECTAKANGRSLSPAEIKPGDILLVETDDNYAGGSDHTCIAVEYVDDGENGAYIKTIEGNRNNQVLEYKRLPGEIHGLCRPDYGSVSEEVAKETLTVTLKTRDDTYSEYSIKAAPGGAITKPDNPSHKGAVFEGWYTDEAHTDTNKINFRDYTVQNDITLYAKYVNEAGEDVCFVTLDAQNGAEPKDVAVKNGGKFTRPVDPVKEEYEFLGWLKEKDGTEYWDFGQTVSKDMSLYGSWKYNVVAVTRITLSEESLVMAIGDKKQITASVEPEDATHKDVDWSSGDESVAKVSKDGTITAVAAGTVTITASAMDESGIKAECSVKVKDHITPLQKLVMEKQTYEIFVGDTVNIVPTPYPADAEVEGYSYSTEETEILSVSADGTVTGLKAGEGYVTISAVGTESWIKCYFRVNNRPDKYMLSKQTWEIKAVKAVAKWEISNKYAAKLKVKGKRVCSVTAKDAGYTEIVGYDKNGDEVIRKAIYVEKPEFKDFIFETKTVPGTTASFNVKDYITGVSFFGDPTSYKSSNKKVLKVSSGGVLTPKKNGKGTLTIKYGKVSYKVKFKVAMPAIKESSIKIKPGRSKQLTLQNMPEAAEYELRVDDATMIEADSSCYVTAMQTGTTYVRLFVDGVEYDKCKVKVK